MTDTKKIEELVAPEKNWRYVEVGTREIVAAATARWARIREARALRHEPREIGAHEQS